MRVDEERRRGKEGEEENGEDGLVLGKEKAFLLMRTDDGLGLQSSRDENKKKRKERGTEADGADVKSESSDDIFDLPPEEDEDEENIFFRDDDRDGGDLDRFSSSKKIRKEEVGGSSSSDAGRECPKNQRGRRGEEGEADDDAEDAFLSDGEAGKSRAAGSAGARSLHRGGGGGGAALVKTPGTGETNHSGVHREDRKKSSLVDRMKIREVELKVTQKQIELEKQGIHTSPSTPIHMPT